MAWSEAARRAALLVRQAHARAKKSLKGKSFDELRGATVFEGHLPRTRKQFAKELRRYRAGTYPPVHLDKMSRVAAASTAVRNAIRRGARIKAPIDTDGKGQYHAARLRIQRRGY
jgi:hypothetical protein